MKNETLGKKYELSVVAADDALMKKLNSTYRGKNKATNVLAFPLSEKNGEIFINIPLAEKEAEKAKIPSGQYADYLFTHSMLHLAGYGHGEKMEKAEDKILKKIYGKKYHNRD